MSHAHIDHSGRVPLLVRRGYDGPIHVQNATRALCGIMLPDSGYLNEKDTEWENKKRRKRGEPPVEPLYTREDAEACLAQFRGAPYGTPVVVAPGVTLRFVDGADTIRLWGDTYPVRAGVHTIGGLSARADQDDLAEWYAAFRNRPPVYLVHGESDAQQKLASRLRQDYQAPATVAAMNQLVEI